MSKCKVKTLSLFFKNVPRSPLPPTKLSLLSCMNELRLCREKIDPEHRLQRTSTIMTRGSQGIPQAVKATSGPSYVTQNSPTRGMALDHYQEVDSLWLFTYSP